MYKIKPFKIRSPQSRLHQKNHTDIMIMAEELINFNDVSNNSISSPNMRTLGQRNLARKASQTLKPVLHSKTKSMIGNTSIDSLTSKKMNLSKSPSSKRELSPTSESLASLTTQRRNEHESGRFSFSLEFQKKVYNQSNNGAKPGKQNPQLYKSRYSKDGGDVSQKNYTVSVSVNINENIHIGSFSLNAEVYKNQSSNKNPVDKQARLDLGVTAEVDECEKPDSYLMSPRQNTIDDTTQRSVGRQMRTVVKSKNSEPVQYYYRQKQNLRISVENIASLTRQKHTSHDSLFSQHHGENSMYCSNSSTIQNALSKKHSALPSIKLNEVNPSVNSDTLDNRQSILPSSIPNRQQSLA